MGDALREPNNELVLSLKNSAHILCLYLYIGYGQPVDEISDSVYESRKHNEIHEHYEIEKAKYLINKLPILLLLAIQLAEVATSTLYILIRVVDVPFDVID